MLRNLADQLNSKATRKLQWVFQVHVVPFDTNFCFIVLWPLFMICKAIRYFAKLIRLQVIIGGGGGGGGVAFAAAPAGGGGAPAAEAPPAEEKKEGKEESEDEDMGFSLFD